MARRQIRLETAYDGTEFAGWQQQPDQRTVQGELERALLETTGQEIRATGCGRTDAGVHALRQTVTFFYDGPIPTEAFRPALNSRLPADMTVLSSSEAAADFHPISSIVRKRYRYLMLDGPSHEVFLRRYAWRRGVPLDVDAMHEAARSLIGQHDFASFESKGSPRQSSVRTVFDLFVRRNDSDDGVRMLQPAADASRLIVLEIEADGFLYNMVRNIVGSLVEVGRGAKPVEWIGETLAARDRTVAGPTAPPHGLYMVGATYPSVL